MATSKPPEPAQHGLADAAARAREWTARRDELIRTAHAGGWSYRAIGEKVGMSHTAIVKIVKRAALAREI